MIEVIPLECSVHPDAYPIIRDLLGEEVAELLLYAPWGDTDDRSDNGTGTETVKGWLRARLHDHGIASVEEATAEPTAQCP